MTLPALPAPPISVALVSLLVVRALSLAKSLIPEVLPLLVHQNFQLSPGLFICGEMASASRMVLYAATQIRSTPWTCR